MIHSIVERAWEDDDHAAELRAERARAAAVDFSWIIEQAKTPAYVCVSFSGTYFVFVDSHTYRHSPAQTMTRRSCMYLLRPSILPHPSWYSIYREQLCAPAQCPSQLSISRIRRNRIPMTSSPTRFSVRSCLLLQAPLAQAPRTCTARHDGDARKYRLSRDHLRHSGGPHRPGAARALGTQWVS